MLSRAGNNAKQLMQSFERKELLGLLPQAQRGRLLSVYQQLTGAGFEAYLVGGSVRDLLRGQVPKDLDLATNARPRAVQKLFKRTVPTGIQHGTVTVLVDEDAFEVTTYRGESTYSDGRRPDAVTFSDSLEQDLKRRDFTINALALDVGRGLLLDAHNGLADLNARIIRTIGQAHERFFEDGLRPVRACRFCSTLEFDLADSVRSAIADPAIHARTRLVAPERFSDELRKGLRARQASRMVRELETSGLRQLFLDAPGNCDSSALARIDELFPAAIELRLAFWWSKIGVVDADRQAARLKLSGRETQWIALYGWLLEQDLTNPDAAALRVMLSQIKTKLGGSARDFLAGVPAGAFPGVDWTQARRLLGEAPLVVTDLDVSGQDLMALGISGPEIGRNLKNLLDLVLADPSLNRRAELLDRLHPTKNKDTK